MLPLSLLRSAQGQQILVELKNGETYNGTLNTIDNWMNLALRDVTLTSSDGKRFWRVSELYVRGNTVKYLQVPDVVLDVVADEKQAREAARNANRNRQQRSRAGRGGRARRGGTAGREQGAYQQQHGGRRYNQQQQYAQRVDRRPPGFDSD